MWKKLWASAPATVLIAVVAFIALVALPTFAAAAPAGARALLTIADGPVQVLRGTQRLTAVEGMALADEDIVRTTDGTRVARIEWPDGRVLDLGPATELMLASERVATRRADLAGSTAVLVRGWAKLSAATDGAGRLAAPGVVAQADARGVLLLHAADEGSLAVFAEARSAEVTPRSGDHATVLREGQAWARSAGAATGAVAPRNASLGEVPRALADALPRRAARFAGHEIDALAIDPIGADDLAAWWRAEPALMALVHPRVSARGAAPKKATPSTRVAVAPPPVPTPKARGAAVRRARAEPVVVPGLPLPVHAGEPASSALALGASTPLAAERIAIAALPAVAPPPALPAAPAIAASPTRNHKRY